MEQAPHVPVLLDEVIAFACAQRDGNEPWVGVDATLGAGGHAEAMLNRMGPSGRLLGLDRDPHALEIAAARLGSFGDRVRFVRAGFADIASAVADSGWGGPVDAVIFDLGVSSMQLDQAERGFSFRFDADLDMRMDPSQEISAFDVVNFYEERELADILFHYGEERHARRIAREICAARETRPIRTTGQLAEIVAAAMPGSAKRDKHPARRTFQAVRIEVNRELDQLESALPEAAKVLAPEGRLVAISYHSLEDRVIKRFMNEAAGGSGRTLQVLTKQPVTPGDEELERNPRSSAAKLRAAQRTDGSWGGDAA